MTKTYVIWEDKICNTSLYCTNASEMQSNGIGQRTTSSCTLLWSDRTSDRLSDQHSNLPNNWGWKVCEISIEMKQDLLFSLFTYRLYYKVATKPWCLLVFEIVIPHQPLWAINSFSCSAHIRSNAIRWSNKYLHPQGYSMSLFLYLLILPFAWSITLVDMILL